MGSIDIIKPLSTVLSSAVNKSWEHRESNQGLLGAKYDTSVLYSLPILDQLGLCRVKNLHDMDLLKT